MNKLIPITLISFALSGPAFAEEVVMGAILPMSGSSATGGEDERRGVDLAVEKINANGGVLGSPLKVIVEDSGGRTPTAIDAAKKLIAINKTPVIIGEFGSGVTIPVAEYVQQQGKVHINIAGSSTQMRSLGRGVFSVLGLDDILGSYAAEDIYASGKRKIAVFVPNNAYGQGISEVLSTKYKALGGEVVATILYAEGQTSYRRELQQLEQSKPDLYVYSAYGKESSTINRESFELGLSDTPWYGIYLTMCTADSDPNFTEGQTGVDLNYTGPNGAEYEKAYKEKFKMDFASTYNGFAYDAVMIAAAAINEAKSTDPVKVTEAMFKVGNGFNGATGDITFDSSGQRTVQPYLRMRMVNGKPVAD
ncbi:ABC transporter substrate-binding protein [Pseudomonas frederiksbergensis]|uniref:Amino acid ABC transporter n=1 Tax=Pseudomonas frederiksbergensis TaxID=104087 RepID=A0A0B1YX46_9PSED|nr:ABC transporter substrate-binding protein [Pseudomonas frederiksbergensis]KHK61556.1 amino acid ABC transporter [Pseudomonas frederiksbergensis]